MKPKYKVGQYVVFNKNGRIPELHGCTGRVEKEELPDVTGENMYSVRVHSGVHRKRLAYARECTIDVIRSNLDGKVK